MVPHLEPVEAGGGLPGQLADGTEGDQSIEQAAGCALWDEVGHPSDREDVTGTERGVPDCDGGYFYNNTAVEVWRDCATVTTWPTNGGVERTIVEINAATFAEIETIMERHSFGDANPVVEVQRAIGHMPS